MAVAITDQVDPSCYFQVRGRVINITTERAAEHIEKLAQKFTGESCAWWGGRNQVIMTIDPENISGID